MSLATKDRYLLHLIKCSLLDEFPEKIPSNTNIESILNMAYKHGVFVLVFNSLNKLGTENTEILNLNKWKELFDKAINKSFIQQIESEKIIDILTKNEINVMPLKGINFKKIYPQPEMRDMSDIDILYDSKYKKKMRDLLPSLGYKAKSISDGVHDIYEKEPIVYIEMHHNLFCKDSPYYMSSDLIWNNSMKDEANPNLHYMTVDDEYIYMCVHHAKHFTTKGFGIRSIIDIYIYNKQNQEIMNQKYITEKLKILSLDKFIKCMEDIGNEWFDQKKSNDFTKNIQNYILDSGGSYGNSIYGILNNIEQYNSNSILITKLKFLFKIIFPNHKLMRIYFPHWYKHKVLLPFFWIIRWIHILTFKSKKLIIVLLNLKKINKKDIDEYSSIKKKLEL